MGGVIALTLTACGTDSVYDEMDQQNNSTQTANESGGRTTTSYTDPNGYKSFWDIYNRQGREMFYHYANSTGSTAGTRLEFEVTPYIGLAYYDNNVFDGTFFDESTFLPEGPFVGLPTQYPNIFLPNSNEIGNFIPAKPINLSGITAPNWGNAELKVFSMDHCHVIGANIPPNTPLPNFYNPNLVFFDISSAPAPYQPTTALEEDFLSKYGKVFFYYWEAKDPVTFALVASGYITPYCDTSTADWADTTIPAANLPVVGTAKLYGNMNCLDTGRSYELVLEDGTYPSETVFNNPLNGRDYKVSIETFRGGYAYPYPTPGSMGGTVSTLKLELY